MAAEQVTVLVVCHANLCRSPMAERLIRASLAGQLGGEAARFDVISAGTHAWTNQPMHPLAAEVLRENSVDESGFRSRRLTEGLVNRADLILTATRQQRSDCVVLDPSAVRSTFTIPQFGRYAAAMRPYSLTAVWPPQRRLRVMIEQVAVVRGDLPVVRGEDEDLPDPVRSPIAAFRRCAAEIQSVVDVMVGLIAPIQTAPR